MKTNKEIWVEFLLTYGWAVLVVLIALGAFVYYGFINPNSFGEIKEEVEETTTITLPSQKWSPYNWKSKVYAGEEGSTISRECTVGKTWVNCHAFEVRNWTLKRIYKIVDCFEEKCLPICKDGICEGEICETIKSKCEKNLEKPYEIKIFKRDDGFYIIEDNDYDYFDVYLVFEGERNIYNKRRW